MPKTDNILRVNTVEQFCDVFGCPPTRHPLFTLCRLTDLNGSFRYADRSMQLNLYTVLVKSGTTCTATYGWREYDFRRGSLNFFAPGQTFSWEMPDAAPDWGYIMAFHPDFVRRFPLGEKMPKLRFFSYDTCEALHISDAERLTIEQLIHQISGEYERDIDGHTQDIVVSLLDVFFGYAERFYTRQFVTRAAMESDMLTRFTRCLDDHYTTDDVQAVSITEIARRLAMSPHYLSDCLKATTGQTAQQHLHNYLIERAKTLLCNTDLSVSEIAYRLGFEYPQYFTRLFRKKTGQTPSAFRLAAMLTA